MTHHDHPFVAAVNVAFAAHARVLARFPLTRSLGEGGRDEDIPATAAAPLPPPKRPPGSSDIGPSAATKNDATRRTAEGGDATTTTTTTTTTTAAATTSGGGGGMTPSGLAQFISGCRFQGAFAVKTGAEEFVLIRPILRAEGAMWRGGGGGGGGATTASFATDPSLRAGVPTGVVGAGTAAPLKGRGAAVGAKRDLDAFAFLIVVIQNTRRHVSRAAALQSPSDRPGGDSSFVERRSNDALSPSPPSVPLSLLLPFSQWETGLQAVVERFAGALQHEEHHHHFVSKAIIEADKASLVSAADDQQRASPSSGQPHWRSMQETLQGMLRHVEAIVLRCPRASVTTLVSPSTSPLEAEMRNLRATGAIDDTADTPGTVTVNGSIRVEPVERQEEQWSGRRPSARDDQALAGGTAPLRATWSPPAFLALCDAAVSQDTDDDDDDGGDGPTTDGDRRRRDTTMDAPADVPAHVDGSPHVILPPPERVMSAGFAPLRDLDDPDVAVEFTDFALAYLASIDLDTSPCRNAQRSAPPILPPGLRRYLDRAFTSLHAAQLCGTTPGQQYELASLSSVVKNVRQTLARQRSTIALPAGVLDYPVAAEDDTTIAGHLVLLTGAVERKSSMATTFAGHAADSVDQAQGGGARQACGAGGSSLRYVPSVSLHGLMMHLARFRARQLRHAAFTRKLHSLSTHDVSAAALDWCIVTTAFLSRFGFLSCAASLFVQATFPRHVEADVAPVERIIAPFAKPRKNRSAAVDADPSGGAVVAPPLVDGAATGGDDRVGAGGLLHAAVSTLHLDDVVISSTDDDDDDDGEDDDDVGDDDALGGRGAAASPRNQPSKEAQPDGAEMDAVGGDLWCPFSSEPTVCDCCAGPVASLRATSSTQSTGGSNVAKSIHSINVITLRRWTQSCVRGAAALPAASYGTAPRNLATWAVERARHTPHLVETRSRPDTAGSGSAGTGHSDALNGVTSAEGLATASADRITAVSVPGTPAFGCSWQSGNLELPAKAPAIVPTANLSRLPTKPGTQMERRGQEAPLPAGSPGSEPLPIAAYRASPQGIQLALAAWRQHLVSTLLSGGAVPGVGVAHEGTVSAAPPPIQLSAAPGSKEAPSASPLPAMFGKSQGTRTAEGSSTASAERVAPPMVWCHWWCHATPDQSSPQKETTTPSQHGHRLSSSEKDDHHGAGAAPTVTFQVLTASALQESGLACALLRPWTVVATDAPSGVMGGASPPKLTLSRKAVSLLTSHAPIVLRRCAHLAQAIVDRMNLGGGGVAGRSSGAATVMAAAPSSAVLADTPRARRKAPAAAAAARGGGQVPIAGEVAAALFLWTTTLFAVFCDTFVTASLKVTSEATRSIGGAASSGRRGERSRPSKGLSRRTVLSVQLPLAVAIDEAGAMVTLVRAAVLDMMATHGSGARGAAPPPPPPPLLLAGGRIPPGPSLRDDDDDDVFVGRWALHAIFMLADDALATVYRRDSTDSAS